MALTLLRVRAGCWRRRRRGRLQRMVGCDVAIFGGGNVNGVSGGLGCGVLSHVVELVDYVAG